MIALGMVASFMTNNLTLGFVLGILVNAPFVLLQYSDAFVTQSEWVGFLSEASMGKQFADFGRGVIFDQFAGLLPDDDCCRDLLGNGVNWSASLAWR